MKCLRIIFFHRSFESYFYLETTHLRKLRKKYFQVNNIVFRIYDGGVTAWIGGAAVFDIPV